ncbi:hypothetical protein PEC311524_04280 [Pectobacterium carotovorum subsp. carotovorum]|nr:hypothetical protein PEC311524_04280 [Pectobacterium carotovorum subsp. carotovorum]
MRLRLSFHIKLFIYLIVFFSSLLLMTGIYYYHDIDKQLYSELGTRAQVQAREIAIIPTLVESVKNRDIKQIYTLAQ